MTKVQRGRNLGQRLKIRRRSKLSEVDDVNSHSAESVPRSKNASVTVDDDDSGSSAPLQVSHQQQDDAVPQGCIDDKKTKRGKKRLSRKEQKNRKKQKRTAP
jgi:hypothetical protein